jgi:hypothetical protein
MTSLPPTCVVRGPDRTVEFGHHRSIPLFGQIPADSCPPARLRLQAAVRKFGDLTEFPIRDMLFPFAEAHVRVGAKRFWITVPLTELSVAVLHRYWRPIWKTWLGVRRIRLRLLTQLLVWALSVAALWLHVYSDFRAVLAERSLSSLPHPSGLREGTDV